MSDAATNFDILAKFERVSTFVRVAAKVQEAGQLKIRRLDRRLVEFFISSTHWYTVYAIRHVQRLHDKVESGLNVITCRHIRRIKYLERFVLGLLTWSFSPGAR